MEKQRGISVTSSVMKFTYEGYEVNLLDTPGHNDFSEDTYRVLTAVDSVLMVIDSVKGVESQTKKLLEVCRLRHHADHDLHQQAGPRGARRPSTCWTTSRTCSRSQCAPHDLADRHGQALPRHLPPLHERADLLRCRGRQRHRRHHHHQRPGRSAPRCTLLGSQVDELRHDVELLEGAAHPFDKEAYLAGEQTPVFFGSAINTFGVQQLLDTFVEHGPAPAAPGDTTRAVSPFEEPFSGFVFKIQANMDPAHRDRIAFFRICSGRFTRGMKVRHLRLGRGVQIANATIFMAQDRTNVEEALPGDIIGIHNHGTIKIGDTFTQGEDLKFTGIPSFAPEHFRKVRLLTR